MDNLSKPPLVAKPTATKQSVSRDETLEKRAVEKPQIQDRLLLVAGLGHPTEYPQHLKWLVTILLAVAAFLDPISYTILYPALPQLPKSFNTTQDVTNLSSTLSLIGPAITPIYWSFLAERRGRRIVLLSSLAIFTLFSGLSGAATSIGMLIAMRCLGSFCSGAPTVAGAAMVADIWPSKTRGFAMSIFYFGPLTGPVFGPVIGGILTQVWGWRSVQWFLTAYSGLVLVLIILLLPETLRSEDRSTATELPSKEPQSLVTRALRRVSAWSISPLRAVAYLRYPAITVIILIASVCFAAVMMSATTLQEAFHGSPYNFSYIKVGLLYLPMALGLILGGLLSGKWSDHIAHKEAVAAARHNPTGSLFYAPESRLKENAWISIALLPGALLMYGWTVQYGVFWVVPMIGWALIGFSTGLMFSLVTTVLTEIIPQKSASLVALNALGRNSFAAVSSSITQPLATAIGSGWSYTGLGAFTVLNVLFVILYQRYGRLWRETVDEKVGVVRYSDSPDWVDTERTTENPETSWLQEASSEEKVGLELHSV